MKKPSKFALRRAKSTLFGRLFCRLVGEERGAVMMEYVVIGVLVVAAAVAMVSLFGKTIMEKFGIMVHTVNNETDKAEDIAKTGLNGTGGYENSESNVNDAGDSGNTIRNTKE